MESKRCFLDHEIQPSIYLLGKNVQKTFISFTPCGIISQTWSHFVFAKLPINHFLDSVRRQRECNDVKIPLFGLYDQRLFLRGIEILALDKNGKIRLSSAAQRKFWYSSAIEGERERDTDTGQNTFFFFSDVFVFLFFVFFCCFFSLHFSGSTTKCQ